jgi:hypothetical protein
MKNIKSFEQLNEGTMISKRNMDLAEFKSQGSFFNREPHSNSSPTHGITMAELNEERKNDLEREIDNVLMRYKPKMDAGEIHTALEKTAERWFKKYMFNK